MSTIGPALRGDALPILKPQGSQTPRGQPRLLPRHGFYMLHAGEALALVLFLSFCIMWVQWQIASPRITKVSGDFLSFWTAGELALEGDPAVVDLGELHEAVDQAHVAILASHRELGHVRS